MAQNLHGGEDGFDGFDGFAFELRGQGFEAARGGGEQVMNSAMCAAAVGLKSVIVFEYGVFDC